MKRRYYSLLLLLPVLILSCGKEVSLETGAKPGDSTGTPISNNCILAKIVQADQATGKAEIAFVSGFNSENKVVTHDVIDSGSNVIINSFSLSYPTGRVQIDAEQYFVVNADGRVSEFHGYEYPDDNTTEKFTVRYTYNAAGQMTLRTETYDTLPGVVQYQMRFTYSGGNLTKEEYEGNTGRSFVKIADISFTYDASKTVKSFLYLQGIAPEISLFQTAINAGVNNTNPVSRIVTSTYNPTTGAVINSFTTNFSNYVINSNNYVQSFDVSGNDYVAGGITAGSKYRLSYNCF